MLALAGTVAVGVAACEDATTSVQPETALLSVAPEGGASDVALDAPVVLTFGHAMHSQAGEYAAVHQGDVNGPTVSGSWMIEENGRVMRFTPDHDWQANTAYAIHLGGGMMDAEGDHVDLGTNGMHMGGEWATDSMMSGGMPGGMSGGQHDHMGEGWDGPENGSHGMIFAFTTAGSS